MAKAKYITDFERDCIRIGVAAGATDAAIGRFLGRNKMAVGNHHKAMAAAGTLDNLPLAFVTDEIGRSILRHEVR